MHRQGAEVSRTMAKHTPEEEGSEEQELEAKELMSKQMTEILLGRVGKLKSLFNQASDTLKQDVDADTNSCTKNYWTNVYQVERAKDLKNRSDPRTESSHHAMLQRPTPSRNFTLKQLFGDAIKEQVTTSTTTKTSAKPERKESFANSLSKHSSKLLCKGASLSRKRAALERELHIIADTNVTRSVENIAFRYRDAAPFDTKGGKLLMYVHTIIAIPRNENIENSFERVISAPVVEKIYDCLFWYNLCLHFIKPRFDAALDLPKNRDKRGQYIENLELVDQDLELLRNDLSRLYVKLIRIFQKIPFLKRDHVHRYLPFAIAQAILLGFRYLCPGSRHLYTTSIQELVYETCCELLLGTQMIQSSVQMTRATLFPFDSRSTYINDEEADASKAAEEEDTSGTESVVTRVNASSSNQEDEEYENLSKTMWQVRCRYDSMQVGGLLQDYLSQSTPGSKQLRPGTTPAHMVFRTLPSANSRVGGSNTFKKTPTRAHLVTQISQQYARHLEDFQAEVKKSRNLTGARVQAVTAQRDKILRSGVARVSRFCSDLAQNEVEFLQEYYDGDHKGNSVGQQRPSRRSKSKTAEGNISGESKGVRNKHLQGDQKQDWHANLAVNINLPPASRVIVAMEKIEASKKSDLKKPRTKARYMLCGMQEY